MKGTPIISIITVVLNNRDGLETTAKSVVKQKNALFEWLVLDGGSTDGGLDIIEKYKDKIAYWRSRKDNGIFDAMNEGIDRATGDYILFLHSGDQLVDEQSLESVQEVVLTAGPHLSLIMTTAIYHYPAGHQMLREPRQIQDYIQYSNPISHQAIFMNRRQHKEIPYDTSYRISADYLCISAMYMRNPRCAYVQRPTVVVLRGGNSTSHTHPLRQIMECAQIQRRTFDLPASRIVFDALRRVRSIAAEALLSRPSTAGLAWYIVKCIKRR